MIVIAAPTCGDTIDVPGDYPTIQDAIDAAGHGDKVVVADGTWKGTGNFKLRFYGKRITVRSANGPENCIINCQGDGRGFYLQDDETTESRIQGFTVKNGQAIYGGAIRLKEASPEIVDCIFQNNNADYGGGVYCLDSSPIITDCEFVGNTSTSSGGGVCLRDVSEPDLLRCVFEQNTAGGAGGGLCSDELVRASLVDCAFRQNTSYWGGGGLFTYDDSMYLLRCQFIENHTTGEGGGVYGNTYGGPRAVSCLFVGNTADGVGGAVSTNWEGGGVFYNCTITGNSATDGGGLYVGYDGSSIGVYNCIVCQNEPNDIVDYDGWSKVFFSLIGTGWDGYGEANITGDALFVDADSGDYRLSALSPCIDAADNLKVPDDITTDLDGNPRFIDDPCTPDTGFGIAPVVDMGAYEFQAVNDCPADVNCDRTVDIDDLFAILGNWGSCDDCPEDVNDDGVVDVDDVFEILSQWGPCE